MLLRTFAATLIATLSLTLHAEPALTVTAGAMPYQVYQADPSDRAIIAVAGAVTDIPDGTSVDVRLTGALGFGAWQSGGDVTQGKWHASIAGVPVGGPYRFEARAGGASIAVDHLLVGDLWVLAGQSNMQGVGNNDGVESPHPRVHVFAMNDTWRVAEEPLHRLNESSDIVHNGSIQDDDARVGLVADVTGWRKGAGLGLAFARTLTEATGRPIGLLACAHGGTSMAQWDPALRDEGGRSLYGSMYRRVQLAGGAVRGVVWYQGESDANPGGITVFAEKFAGLISAIRSDFNDPELPFYYVQIGRFTKDPDGASWDRIQQLQLEAESAIPHTAMVGSIHLSIDDAIHISTEGLIKLGEQLGARALTVDYGTGGVLSGPRLASMAWKESAFGPGPDLHVTFEGVNGKLESDGSVWGFTALNADGYSIIFRQLLHPDDPNTVVLSFDERPQGAKLWYGKTADPVCTVHDSLGFGIPAFGPVDLPQ